MTCFIQIHGLYCTSMYPTIQDQTVIGDAEGVTTAVLTD